MADDKNRPRFWHHDDLAFVLEPVKTVPSPLRGCSGCRRICYKRGVADARWSRRERRAIRGGVPKVAAASLCRRTIRLTQHPRSRSFYATFERSKRPVSLLFRGAGPAGLAQQFTQAPLKQDRYAEGFGTLFTAEYEGRNADTSTPACGIMIPAVQSIGRLPKRAAATVNLSNGAYTRQQREGDIDWVKVGMELRAGMGAICKGYVPKGATGRKAKV